MAKEQKSQKLTGNVGRTMSVADLILTRTRLLKPSIPTIPDPATPPLLYPENKSEKIVDVDVEKDSIIASDRHKEMIFSEGVENKKFYLKKQSESEEWRPWFHFIKKESQSNIR